MIEVEEEGNWEGKGGRSKKRTGIGRVDFVGCEAVELTKERVGDRAGDQAASARRYR
jgi:hypothetical protein